MDRRRFLAASAGIAGVIAGCSLDAGESTYDVGMSAKRFLPETVEVAPDESVVWKNTSARAHSVTAYEQRIPAEASYFASGGFSNEQAARDAWITRGGGTIYGDETYRHTFRAPGTYHYFCIPHEPQGMVGRVVVSG